MKKNTMVSIIMLSHNSAQYVEESVRSVMAQTYQNWELLFVDDNSMDDTITKMMTLKDEAKIRKEDYAVIDRIKVSQTVSDRGEAVNRNSLLREAQGRWIAFLDVGDVWAPDKLEKQVKFMEENGYSFSYTNYGLMNNKSQNRGVVISGKEHVTFNDMLRCCWPAYLTVMYDAQKVGKIRLHNTKANNDYALWLSIAEKNDCHLLGENLATMRTPYGLFSRFLRTDKVKWRYEVYRVEEDLGPITSFFYTIRNGWNGLRKWMKYVKKDI
ncbi:MAG: glycosyltransferase family 2 protein [Prevotella sp.]|nr:glycosyltransferase family 2 protein [Prevotella sp.]